MVLPVSDKLRNQLAQPSPDLNFIVEVDGIPKKYGAAVIQKIAKIGDPGLLIGGFLIGGLVNDPESREFLDMDGTSKSVSQQLRQDRGGTSSIATFKISIVDVNGEVSEDFRPGNLVPDIIGREVTVYSAAQGAAHPEDSLKIFFGVVQDVIPETNAVVLNISHADERKKTDIFRRGKTKLDGAISDSVTTISLVNASVFISPADIFNSYIVVDTEVIQFGSISGSDLIDCTRGALGTTAASHSDGARVKSLYTLTGRPLPMTLKLLISSADTFFQTGVSITNFNQIGITKNVDNAVFFKGVDVIEKYNLKVGDFITTTGASNGANNVSLKTINAIVIDPQGSYIVVAGVTFVTELGTAGTISFKSQFNVLPQGCAIHPKFIDIDEFNRLDSLFISSFATYEVKIKKRIKAKDFIDRELLFPSRLFSISRKTRISVGMLNPPLANEKIITLGQDNILNPEDLKVQRGTSRYLYNLVTYNYDEDPLSTEVRETRDQVSEESKARIPREDLELEVNAKGIPDTGTNQGIIDANMDRLLSRYQFGAEVIKGIKIFYRVGIELEAGDVVILDGENLNIFDSQTGGRVFGPRLMEIISINTNHVDGEVRVTLIDTKFGLLGRFSVFSGVSQLAASSTTTKLNLKPSFGAVDLNEEILKWVEFVGEKIRVRSPDFSFDEEVTIDSISETEAGTILLETPLSGAPSEDFLVEIPEYPDTTDKKDNALYKELFASFNASINIASGTSGTVFTVDPGEGAKLAKDAPIVVHSLDFSDLSEETTIASVVGDVITVDDDLGFTPASTYLVELGIFPDGGFPYRFI